MAALQGYALEDRHYGNIMNHTMMDRPMQVDLGMHSRVEGLERDNALAVNAVAGMRSAGLTDEADILDGLLREAMGRGDVEGFHDLTQQGVSRLMKIKQVPKAMESYSPLLPQTDAPF